jgi:hypothetical protein
VDGQTIAGNITRVLTGLDAVSLVGGIGFALLVYMLPTILAAVVGNGPRRVAVIGILNLLVGWTGLAWFALIAWGILGRPRASEDAENEEDLAPFVHPAGTG